jgi:hypothetical protein
VRRLCALWIALALTACSSGGGVPTPVPTISSRLVLPDLSGPPMPPSRVVLISVSGLLPDHYRRPGLAGGREPAPMRTLAQLAERGVFSDGVEVVTPAAVHPVHATLVTGRSPREHGIMADRLLGEHGVRNARYEHASRLQGPSLWQAALAEQLGVVALGWPTTAGANLDYLLPDLRPSRGESWLQAIAGAATPWLVERVTKRAPASAAPGWPSPPERDGLMVDLACDIAGSEALPALWLIRLEGGAAAELEFGPGSSESWRAFVAVDRELTRLAKCFARAGLLDSSAWVITGDRALRPVHTIIEPNVALARAGLIQVGARIDGVERWSAIARSSGGSALVYAQGEDDAIAARRALGLAADESRALQVVPASELRERGADPRAWFGIDAEPGFALGNSARGPLARPSNARGDGGYPSDRPGSQVGFVAWGRGLRTEVRVPVMQQLDIAPTVASLLGFRLADAAGRPLLGALQPGSGSRPPPAAPR